MAVSNLSGGMMRRVLVVIGVSALVGVWSVTKQEPVFTPAAKSDPLAEDVRGVRLRMLPAELPAEFKNLRTVPSAILLVAEQAEQCAELEARWKTCLIIFLDGTSNERRVYAVLLDGVRLGTFSDRRVAEGVLATKYGPPKHRIEGSSIIGTHLSWNKYYKFDIDCCAVNTARHIIEDPYFVDRHSSGLSSEGDILVAEVREGPSGYYATLALVDMPSAFRVRKASDEKRKALKDSTIQEELKRAKPDRF